jgi:hypothetical protein
MTVGQSMLILAQEGAVVEPLVSAWRGGIAGGAVDTVEVLQQAAGESLTDFKRRLSDRLAGIEQAGRAIERGAFVAKSGFGLPDVLATVALLSSLVATMVSVGTGRVYLCGHAGDSQASCALEALADAMRDQVRGTGVEVVTEEPILASRPAVVAAVTVAPNPG